MTTSMLGRVSQAMDLVRLNPLYAAQFAARVPRFIRQYATFKRMSEAGEGPRLPFARVSPLLFDADAESGSARGAYFCQDLLVAQHIFERNPKRHVDVGSRIDGFVAHVASFRSLDVLDIRPQTSSIRNVRFIQGNLMADLPAELRGCTDSLSCLHALEHFGLGRYGDPLDPAGHVKGFANLVAMLSPGGVFYFSVPLGPLRVAFNGHRVFSLEYLLTMIAGHGLSVQRFSFVDDPGSLHEGVALDANAIETNCGCRMGCAIFELTN